MLLVQLTKEEYQRMQSSFYQNVTQGPFSSAHIHYCNTGEIIERMKGGNAHHN